MRTTIMLVTLWLCGNCLAQLTEDGRVSTRYGTFTLGKRQMLLYNGHPLRPAVQGNNGLDLGSPFHIVNRDVILATIFGGTACPYLYQFITVTKDGASATQQFGTCNEAFSVKRNGDAVSLAMHDYRGPFEPEEEKTAARRRTEIFVFHDGVVSKSTSQKISK